MLTERQAARLARQANRTRWMFLGGVLSARKGLRTAALRGDMVAVRALATVGNGAELDDIWREVPPGMLVDAERQRAASQIALAPDPAFLTPFMRAGLAVTATLQHPVGDIARVKAHFHLDAELADELCRYAERTPVLAEFCRVNQLVPSDPTDAVRYFLLTGQFAQYQAADPDGSVLRQAYRFAAAPDQVRLRQAVLDHGAAELLYTLVDHNQRDWVAASTVADDGELERLAKSLAKRGDWLVLWRVVTATSVAKALGLVRLFPADWRPDTEPGWRLLTTLRQQPKPEHTGRDRPTRLRTLVVGDPVSTIAVAPDLSEVAATCYPRDSAVHLTVFDLAHGTINNDNACGKPDPTERESVSRGAMLDTNEIVHLGGGTVLRGEADGLVRYGNGRQVLDEEPVLLLTAAGDHYVAVPMHNDGNMLLIGSAHRPTPERIMPTTADGLANVLPADGSGSFVAVGLTPDGSRIAVTWSVPLTSDEQVTRSRIVVFDGGGAVIADSGLTEFVSGISFAADDLLVAEGSGTVKTWRIIGAELREEQVDYDVVRQVLAVPGTRYAVALSTGRYPFLYDAGTLEQNAEFGLADLASGSQYHFLTAAGVHGFAALTDTANGTIEVHDLRLPAVLHLFPTPPASLAPAETSRVIDLLTAPVSSMQPADVATVVELGDYPAARLLQTSLEHRFSTDVQLGYGPAPGAFDIGLGGAPW